MQRIERTLKKVGGSVMLPIPKEILEETHLRAGQHVAVSSEGRGLHVEPIAERPAPDAVEFMARFTEKYDEAFRNLAER
jgi:antitoxin component of MazEF toxin-antitoxin module